MRSLPQPYESEPPPVSAPAEPTGTWCRKCRAFNPPGNKFCGKCGASAKSSGFGIAFAIAVLFFGVLVLFGRSGSNPDKPVNGFVENGDPVQVAYMRTMSQRSVARWNAAEDQVSHLSPPRIRALARKRIAEVDADISTVAPRIPEERLQRLTIDGLQKEREFYAELLAK
jgi:hypothetical protein